MKTHKQFEPKLRKNYLLGAAAVIFIIAVIVMWKYMNELSLTIPDMLIFTGLALFTALAAISQYMKKRENYKKAEELTKLQKDVGTGNYNDSSIFFRDEDNSPLE